MKTWTCLRCRRSQAAMTGAVGRVSTSQEMASLSGHQRRTASTASGARKTADGADDSTIPDFKKRGPDNRRLVMNKFEAKKYTPKPHPDTDGIDVDYDMAQAHDRHAPDMPLPPFMRAKQARTLKRFGWVPYRGQYREGNALTEAEKARRAPFATAFARNPYAAALAEPVRECTLTGVRLPRSCLLDFHVVDAGDPLAAGSLDGGLQLLPISLAADLVPRAKSEAKQTEQERAAVARWEEEKAASPMQSRAGYMVARRAAVRYISADVKKRLFPQGVSLRTATRLRREGNPHRLGWRPDMDDMVLRGLRNLLSRRLNYFVQNKSNPTKEGLIQALATGDGLTQLHTVEEAACVLRLTGQAESHPVRDEAALATRRISQGEGSDAPEHDEVAVDDESDTSDMIGSKTLQQYKGSFEEKQAELTPWMTGCLPQPPPAHPLHVYFPTVRWRNTRIPLYDLPALLGDELADKAVGKSAFAGYEYAVVQHSRGTQQLLKTLMKLHAYTADGKDSATRA